MNRDDFAKELYLAELGRLAGGAMAAKVSAGLPLLHVLFTNPFCYGVIRYRGQLYPGFHEPLVSGELFARV